jgi:hypothetical protein
VEPKILIKKLTFSDGTEIVPEADEVLVIVGPNNSGKSVTLRSVREKLGKAAFRSPVLNAVEFEKIGSASDVLSCLDQFVRRNPDSPANEPEFSFYGRNGTEQIFGANCERLERATMAALDPIVLFPAPI